MHVADSENLGINIIGIVFVCLIEFYLVHGTFHKLKSVHLFEPLKYVVLNDTAAY